VWWLSVFESGLLINIGPGEAALRFEYSFLLLLFFSCDSAWDLDRVRLLYDRSQTTARLVVKDLSDLEPSVV